MGFTRSVEVIQLKQYCTDKRRIQVAIELWKQGAPLDGTPAEKYIVETRKIPLHAAQKMQIKSFTGPVNIPEFDQNAPYNDYVMVPVYNLDDDLIGVQIIQVDPDGSKASNPTNSHYYCKKYLGAIKPAREGKAAVLHKTENVDLVFVAEGIETAASVASLEEIHDHYTVLASLGVTEFASTLAYIKTHYPPGATVVLLKDHDTANSPADLEFKRISAEFGKAGYQVIIKEPEQLNDDWNDILVRGGITELVSQFRLDDLPLYAEESADLRNMVYHFNQIYQGLLTPEKLAEEKNTLLLLQAVAEQMLVQLERIEQEQTVQKTIEPLKNVGRIANLVRAVLSEYTDQLPSKPKLIRKFERSAEQLEQLELKSRNALVDNEDIDLSKDPEENPNGDLFKAYAYAMHHCILHLKSLIDKDIYNFQQSGLSVQFHKMRLVKIDAEMKSIPHLIKQFIHEDKLIVSQLKEQLVNLKNEKKFHEDQIKYQKQQLKLIPVAHYTNLPFAQYYSQFIEDANNILAEGVITQSHIRERMVKSLESKRKEVQEQYSHKMNGVRQNCYVERKKAIPLMRKYLHQLVSIIKNESNKIEEQYSHQDSRLYQEYYLQAMSDLSGRTGIDGLLQRWLNNLEQFKVASSIIYKAPERSEQVNEVELIEYDSDEEDTLNTLCNGVYIEEMEQEEFHSSCKDDDEYDKIDRTLLPLNQGESSQAELVRKTALSMVEYLRPWYETKLDHTLNLTIEDFAERLAVNLYKSFEVSSPAHSNGTQEFDGLAFRRGRLTILERKTNDGTGPGLLQRNFCQGKIASKQAFIQKGIAQLVSHHPHPEPFIHIEVPKDLSWYSNEFTPTMRKKLISAAKSIIIEALRTMSIEFTVNRPTSYSPANYSGLFFRQDLIQDVRLRFSTSGKGNEDIAHSLMEKVSKQRTDERESVAYSLG